MWYISMHSDLPICLLCERGCVNCLRGRLVGICWLADLKAAAAITPAISVDLIARGSTLTRQGQIKVTGSPAFRSIIENLLLIIAIFVMKMPHSLDPLLLLALGTLKLITTKDALFTPEQFLVESRSGKNG